MQVLIRSFYSRLIPSEAKSAILPKKDCRGVAIYGLKPILSISLTMATLLPIVGCNIIKTSLPGSKSDGSAKMFSTWKRVTANQGKYSILMPGKPETYSLPETSPQGRDYTAWITISIDRKDPRTSYSVVYVVNSDMNLSSAIDGDHRRKAIDETIQHMLKSRNLQTISSSQFSLNGHPGGEVRYRYQKGTGRMRFFVVENRIYMIMAQNAQTPVNEEEMMHFLQSFKLL
jgi:hypothetical protein